MLGKESTMNTKRMAIPARPLFAALQSEVKAAGWDLSTREAAGAVTPSIVEESPELPLAGPSWLSNQATRAR